MQAKQPSPPTSHAAPRLVEPMMDREVREGEPVQFQCRIVGVPDPVVQWFYNNQIIKPSKYFQLSADSTSGYYRLTIAGVFPEDDGSYKCVARNPVGEVACIAQLRVIRKYRRTFSVLHLTASWTDDHFVGQTSAVGQPTRPTQPFIFTGSINE